MTLGYKHGMGVQVVPAKRLIKSVSAKARSGGSLLSQERMRTVSRGISLRALGSKPEAAVVSPSCHGYQPSGFMHH